ncbi:regulatory LuxR family protein [Shimia isoporae]|uniref:Regulatory LuxR family protein n=1 Tax=Shimia isoporae TaxID=647720 RepID=A0A4R1NAX0_9RHOB|nr:helix-turn-helix transcriptional regulator [Shimia isoporae]TCL00566.1 regulatory LuxR family protein [Shimia isoporae]
MINKKRLKWAFVATLVCAIVMLIEDGGEALGWVWVEEWDELHVWEFMIVGLLIVAVVILGIEVRNMQRYQETLEDKISRASGAFEDLLEAYFNQWSFSAAERDITRLILKGCSTAEIAEIRNSKEGTVKAQTNSIYKKSGYAGKTQLLSAFLEDLTDGGSVAAVAN